MHTVRNRRASHPRNTKTALTDLKSPVQRIPRQELGLIARGGVLAGSSSMPCSMAPDPAEENRRQKRRNPKGKKARKAAARKAAAATAAAASPTLTAQAHHGEQRGGKRRNGGPTSPPAPPPAHPVAELEPGTIRDLCLQTEPALALLLPSQPEPLVETPAPVALPEPERVAEPAPIGGYVAFEKQPAPALTLPDRPEPLVEIPALLTETVPAPASALAALAALADAQAAPLPRSRALVPARRQGLVDVIAFLLRDSGRRLARWSARRHKTRAEQAALRHAQARQINLQRELEALDALRRSSG